MPLNNNFILGLHNNILCLIKNQAKDVCFLLCLFSTLLFTQCGDKKEGKDKTQATDNTIAKVYDETLTDADLPSLENEHLSSKDSITLIHQFVQDWIRFQTMVHVCKQKSKSTPEIDKKVNEYRNTLLMHQYKTDFFANEIDTLVSEKELLSELKKMPEENRLNSTIVKAKFIVINRKAPKIDLIRSLITKLSEKENKELKSICLRFAEQFKIQNGHWIDLNVLVAETPFATHLKKYERKGNFEITDEDNIYLLMIEDIKTVGSLAPLTYNTDKLKATIVHDRKTKKWALFEDKCYKEALDKQEIEFNKK